MKTMKLSKPSNIERINYKSTQAFVSIRCTSDEDVKKNLTGQIINIKKTRQQSDESNSNS